MNEEPSILNPERRSRILQAAFTTFVRYGFGKTSMEEVARTANISRQSLYLYFGNKEDLFRSAMQNMFEEGLKAAEQVLAGDGSLEFRLLRALDEWFGRHAGTPEAQAEELLQRSRSQLGDMMGQYGAAMTECLGEAISSAELAVSLEARGLAAHDVARTLYACGATWKHTAHTRAEFVTWMSAAIRLLDVRI